VAGMNLGATVSKAMGTEAMGTEATASIIGFRGPRVHVGIGLGTFWGPYWGGGPDWPRDAYPPVVVAPPPVVVQPVPPPPQYWYYCDAAQAYYPYVQQCPGGWRQVLPTPPR
jgi:hypothetical protein